MILEKKENTGKGNARFLRKTVGDPVIYYLCASTKPISIIYAHDTSIGLSQAISLHWYSREGRGKEQNPQMFAQEFRPRNSDQREKGVCSRT